MGLIIVGKEKRHTNVKTTIHQYIAFFGAEPIFVMLTWKQLATNGWIDLGCQIMPAHLLWAFSWMKGYSYYEVHAGQATCDKKTFCDRVWFLITWENSIMVDTCQRSLTTVDGADGCRISSMDQDYATKLSRMKKMLLNNDTVVVDCGYCGGVRIHNPDMGNDQQKKAMSKAYDQHETANGRMKNWN
eukprot:5438783-Ditylum_brightwellii.AAC.1